MAKCAECTYFDWKNKKTSSRDYRWCKEMHTYKEPTDSSCRYFIKREKAETGCFITTVVVDVLGYSDDCWILNTLRKFRKNIMQKDYRYADLLLSYDAIGPQIAESLNNMPEKEQISLLVCQYYLIPICKLINDENYTSAVNLYVGMVRFLQNQLYVEDDVNNYTYDDSVLPEEKGHGRARVIPAMNI